MSQNYYNPYSNGFYPPVDPKLRDEMRKVEYYQQKRKNERNELIGKGIVLGATILAMIIIESIIVSLLYISPYYTLFKTSALFQNSINIFAVHICAIAIPFSIMALIMKNYSARPLIPTEKVGKLKMFLWVSLGLGGCLIADYATNELITLFKLFGYKLTQPEFLPAKDPITAVILVFSTVVAPAIFEEYAFRCCSLSLLKNHGKAFAVVAVSIVFGLIHGNIIQFVFAFLVGLVLGYVTIKTNSIIPAMLIHGLNNSLSVINEILEFTSGEKIADTVLNVIIYIIIALAIISLIYLYRKSDFFIEKDLKRKEPFALNILQKLLCLVPGLFIPFLILIWKTTSYITPIS